MKRASAFTLIELLVAMCVTALLVTMLVSFGGSASSAWVSGSSQAESYSLARGVISNLGQELEGAVIDLDMGFRVDVVDGEPGNFVLKFLRRRNPDDKGGVEKIAYQLAWAGRGMLPEVKGGYDEEHAIPVLIRTSSTDLSDVYKVATPADVSGWANHWGPLASGDTTRTGIAGGSDGQTIVEIAAENVLAWKVTPKYWNGARVESDDPDHPKYFSEPPATIKYLTSDKAPTALEIRVAIVPGQIVPRLRSFSQWGALRTRSDLFDYTSLGADGFDGMLRQQLRNFVATFYLSSRTP